MKVSDVLLATMLVSAFGIQAQDSVANKSPKILTIPEDTTLVDSTQTSEISLIVKHIDSLYNNRATNNPKPLAKEYFVKNRATNNPQPLTKEYFVKNKATNNPKPLAKGYFVKNRPRPHLYCPACGRG